MVVIIVLLLLNVIGFAFFSGLDGRISSLGETQDTVVHLNNKPSVVTPVSPHYYISPTPSYTDVYSELKPAMQQIKASVSEKLNQQKLKIQQYENQLKTRKDDLLLKQQQIQTELDNLNETQQYSMTEDQKAKINQLKYNLENKINSISDQLKGVSTGQLQCSLPVNNYSSYSPVVPIYTSPRRDRVDRQSKYDKFSQGQLPTLNTQIDETSGCNVSFDNFNQENRNGQQSQLNVIINDVSNTNPNSVEPSYTGNVNNFRKRVTNKWDNLKECFDSSSPNHFVEEEPLNWSSQPIGQNSQVTNQIQQFEDDNYDNSYMLLEGK